LTLQPHAEEARALLERPNFFHPAVQVPRLEFHSGKKFRFASSVETPWPVNNQVPGWMWRVGANWASRPTVVLAHGWNGELGYYLQFPWLARMLNRRGLNVATLELPYHAARRPRQPGAVRNFLSPDLWRMAEAIHQALADLAALMAWLRAQGVPRIGLWGISLGGWLGGLLACGGFPLSLAALMTPVVRMDRALQELPFCASIRPNLREAQLSTDAFNLVAHAPSLSPNQLLLVASQYDLFAPPATVEELWESWGQPSLWRVPHGHISVLFSGQTMERTAGWLHDCLT